MSRSHKTFSQKQSVYYTPTKPRGQQLKKRVQARNVSYASLQSKAAREGGDAFAKHCSLPPKTMPHQTNKTPALEQICKKRGETLSKMFANFIRRTNLRRNKSLRGGRRFHNKKLLSLRRLTKPPRRMEQI